MKNIDTRKWSLRAIRVNFKIVSSIRSIFSRINVYFENRDFLKKIVHKLSIIYYNVYRRYRLILKRMSRSMLWVIFFGNVYNHISSFRDLCTNIFSHYITVRSVRFSRFEVNLGYVRIKTRRFWQGVDNLTTTKFSF